MSDNEVQGAGLSREQKIIFFLLLVFSIFGVSLGLVKIRNSFYAPFALNKKVPDTIRDEIVSVDSLRYRDTDRDTLSDFDELYIYGTSPYLLDTFSYGMSDAEVIRRGLPLCPGGEKNCGNPIVNEAMAINNTIVTSTAATPVVDNAAFDLQTALRDPKQIRQLLSDGGVDPEALKSMSDTDLINVVANIMSTNTSTFATIDAISKMKVNPEAQP